MAKTLGRKSKGNTRATNRASALRTDLDAGDYRPFRDFLVGRPKGAVPQAQEKRTPATMGRGFWRGDSESASFAVTSEGGM